MTENYWKAELFPELTTNYKDPNSSGALHLLWLDALESQTDISLNSVPLQPKATGC